MDLWTTELHRLYDKAVGLYRTGDHDYNKWFAPDEEAFLASIGARRQHLFDFAEDFVNGGEPDWDTALLILAARRDYFLTVQRGTPSDLALHTGDLPPKTDALDGIPWLPRILVKARVMLEGGKCDDIMYCCGGDRRFFTEHGLHPADFLRTYWATRGDERRMLEYVKSRGKSFGNA